MGSRTARLLLLFSVSSSLGCGAGPGGGVGGDDDGGSAGGLDGGGGGGGLDGTVPPGLDGATVGVDAGGDPPPDDEERCNGADDNGDGRVDESCACVIGSTQPCYPGDRDVAGVGACTLGTQVCIETGVEFGAWGACTGAEPPGEETCDGTDDDCDGFVDDGCECDPSETRPCYTGPFGTEGVGECVAGVQACEPGPGGVGSMFGACTGDVTPSASEVCDGVDDDCDGAVDDGCACSPGDTRACYTGAPGTDGVGPCRAGAQACVDDGAGTLGWGACAGAVLPGADSCNGVDDDCDGTVDEGCSCAPGDTRPCYGGPAGTGDVGACRGGTQTCEPGPGGVAARGAAARASGFRRWSSATGSTTTATGSSTRAARARRARPPRATRAPRART